MASGLQHASLEQKYTRIKKIGKGSFGEAVLVRCKQDGKRYVAKEINLSQMSLKEKEEAKNEITVLSKLNHPNIVRLRESLINRQTMYIVMEYADGGDLDQKIKAQKKSGRRFSEEQVLDWFVQIALALKHLHDKKILHRDLKSQNVFLTSKNIIKLGDFGISTVLRNTLAQAQTVCGTPYYFSPEICKNKPYNNKSDIWALGCILYELSTLSHAFNGRTMFELMKAICNGKYSSLPSSYSEDMTHLVAKMLHVNPVLRLSIDNILRIHYVQRALRNFTEHFKQLQAQQQQQGALPRPASGATTSTTTTTTTSSSSEEDKQRAQQHRERELAQLGGHKGGKPVAAGGGGVFNLAGPAGGGYHKPYSEHDALRKELEKREQERRAAQLREKETMEAQKRAAIEKDRRDRKEREAKLQEEQKKREIQREKERRDREIERERERRERIKEKERLEEIERERREREKEKRNHEREMREAREKQFQAQLLQKEVELDKEREKHRAFQLNQLEQWREKEREKERQREAQRAEQLPHSAAPHLPPAEQDHREVVRKQAQDEREKKDQDVVNAQRQAFWEMRQEAEKNKQRWKQQYDTPWQTSDDHQDRPSARREKDKHEDELQQQRQAYMEMRKDAEKNRQRLMEEWNAQEAAKEAPYGKHQPYGNDEKPLPQRKSSQVPELPELPQGGGHGKPISGRKYSSPDQDVDAMLNDMLNDAVYGEKENVPDELKHAPLLKDNHHYEPHAELDDAAKAQIIAEAEEEFQTMRGLIDTILAEGKDLLPDDEIWGDDAPLLQ